MLNFHYSNSSLTYSISPSFCMLYTMKGEQYPLHIYFDAVSSLGSAASSALSPGPSSASSATFAFCTISINRSDCILLTLKIAIAIPATIIPSTIKYGIICSFLHLLRNYPAFIYYNESHIIDNIFSVPRIMHFMMGWLSLPVLSSFSRFPACSGEKERCAKTNGNEQRLPDGGTACNLHDGSFSKDWNLYPISSHLVSSSSRISAFVFEVL